MSTHGLVTFLSDDKNSEPIAALYVHWDGYPSGFGQRLQEFLSDFVVVNSLGGNRELRKQANGMGCLAALTVAHFKENKPGDFYLFPPNSKQSFIDYNYVVYVQDGIIRLEVFEGDSVLLYDGPNDSCDMKKLDFAK